MDPETLAKWARDAWNEDIGTDDRTAWTEHLNRTLASHAPAGLKAFGTGLGRHYGRYLLDHCWSKSWVGMAGYEGLVLAAEFEFAGTKDAIEEDLVKLADVRAEARVFLGNLWGSQWADVAEEIARDASSMLYGHARARDDWIVLALGPKGRREREEGLRVWCVTAGQARSMD